MQQSAQKATECVASSPSPVRWGYAVATARRGRFESKFVHPAKLRPAQLRLVSLLLKGPLAHGYRTKMWTTACIAEVIIREFGVTYHQDHVDRLRHSLGWSPRVKKTLRGWAPHIVFADESGLLLIPNVVKTRAPRGQTPVHRRRYRRDKISVISGQFVGPH